HTLSLHDALPIFAGGLLVEPPVLVQRAVEARQWSAGSRQVRELAARFGFADGALDAAGLSVAHNRLLVPDRIGEGSGGALDQDRKSTRLNSSHVKISYAVFCLK